MPMFDDLRADWDALPSTNPQPVDPKDRTEFVVHWWGSTLPDLTAHESCYALMRSTQKYHMNTRGFADIGYNGVICAHARAIEARGIDLQGAHASGHNVTAYGWCFMTPLDGYPTDEMRARMAVALADCEEHSFRNLATAGHRDVAATDCPGDQIEAWVKAGLPNPIPQEEETLWVDYSWARPDTTGFAGVVRYLEAPEKGTRPDLTAAEVAEIHAKGLSLGLYWQARDASVLEGYDVGIGQAWRANWEADAIGVPMHVPIFYVVDEDYSPEQVERYFDGVLEVLDGRPVGIYGSARIVTWARSTMGIEYAVQTSSWSGGTVVSDANLYQRKHNLDTGSGLYDELLLMNPFPAWEPGQVLEPPTVPDLSSVLESMVSSLESMASANENLALVQNGLVARIEENTAIVDSQSVRVPQAVAEKLRDMYLKFQ